MLVDYLSSWHKLFSLITPSPNYEKLYGSLEALVEKGAKFHMGQSLYDQLDLFRDLSPTPKHIVEKASLEKRILYTVHYFFPREFQLFLFIL